MNKIYPTKSDFFYQLIMKKLLWVPLPPKWYTTCSLIFVGLCVKYLYANFALICR